MGMGMGKVGGMGIGVHRPWDVGQRHLDFTGSRGGRGEGFGREGGADRLKGTDLKPLIRC